MNVLWWMIRLCEYACEMSHEPDKNEKGRANCGVWQLSLFNHLGPECTNGDSCSGIQGRIGLNIRIFKNVCVGRWRCIERKVGV